jgi:hypothetical protein
MAARDPVRSQLRAQLRREASDVMTVGLARRELCLRPKDLEAARAAREGWATGVRAVDARDACLLRFGSSSALEMHRRRADAAAEKRAATVKARADRLAQVESQGGRVVDAAIAGTAFGGEIFAWDLQARWRAKVPAAIAEAGRAFAVSGSDADLQAALRAWSDEGAAIRQRREAADLRVAEAIADAGSQPWISGNLNAYVVFGDARALERAGRGHTAFADAWPSAAPAYAVAPERAFYEAARSAVKAREFGWVHATLWADEPGLDAFRNRLRARRAFLDDLVEQAYAHPLLELAGADDGGGPTAVPKRALWKSVTNQVVCDPIALEQRLVCFQARLEIIVAELNQAAADRFVARMLPNKRYSARRKTLVRMVAEHTRLSRLRGAPASALAAELKEVVANHQNLPMHPA